MNFHFFRFYSFLEIIRHFPKPRLWRAFVGNAKFVLPKGGSHLLSFNDEMTMCPRQRCPWTFFLGRWVPLTMCPCDEASLTVASRPRGRKETVDNHNGQRLLAKIWASLGALRAIRGHIASASVTITKKYSATWVDKEIKWVNEWMSQEVSEGMSEWAKEWGSERVREGGGLHVGIILVLYIIRRRETIPGLGYIYI